MTVTVLSKALSAGRMICDLAAPERPDLDLYLGGDSLGEVMVEAAGEGHWRALAQVPVEQISDGVQTFLFVPRAGGASVAAFTLVAGEALPGDLRAELDLLRAEFEIVKRALRRVSRSQAM